MEISGRTILVAGGASGLGAATVERLSAAGARVVAADTHVANGRALAERLGGRVEFVPMDVTSPSSVEGALDRITQQGELHGVVNCAGVLGAARLIGRDGAHDLELFRRIIDVNLTGTFNVARLAAVRMAKNAPLGEQERGVIVNTASIAAFEGQIGQTAYAASKGGVTSMTLPMARELAKFGIRVVAIAPGLFRTAMIDAATESVQNTLTEQTVFPPRMGHPVEFAALVQHIFENPMLNGSVLRLDGAMRMAAK